MPEVLISNDDITVLGPPSSIELLVDIGPQGQRGSQVFVGTGNPNSITIGQTPELNDLFINAAPGGEYGYMYQYVSEPGGDTWIKILDLNPAIYSTNYLTDFVDGTAEIVIPISDIVIVTGTPLVADNFNIQLTSNNANPVASTISSVVVDSTDLTITVNAVESASGVWQNLDGLITTFITISIVPVTATS